MQEKLHKYMASCGVASRRKSEALILEGAVEVNGETITNLGYRIDPLQDVVKVKGKIIHLPKEKKYYMFFKPEGYLTTTHDPEGRPTIFDLLPELKGKVNPVGRLDKDTEGLLFLTNDGEFAFRLTHPKFEVKKTYRVIVQGELTPRAIHTLETGVKLEDGLTAPAKVGFIEKRHKKTLVEITIHEGKKRQVRRMFEAVGFPVVFLKRIEVDRIVLKNIDKGQYRELTSKELIRLKSRLQLPLE